MEQRFTRRQFLGRTGSLTAGLWLGAPAILRAGTSPNEKLDIGVIGVANRGGGNLGAVAGENIVALCDVDANYLGGAAKRFPQAKTYRDYRRMIDSERLDAVVISTPDHHHAPATLRALHAGCHVYCEKPLAHSLWETREMARVAREKKRVTQMGIQIHAGDNYRRVVELVQSGAIGPVRECHVWCGKTWSGGERPQDTPAVPEQLDWDLWLGPAPERPYHRKYVPAHWRRWWDFGSGTLGDMGCHYMDLAFWALELRYPETVSARCPHVPHPETTPPDLAVRMRFPARGERPPVMLHWYDTGQRPPQHLDGLIPGWGSGVLFVGEKGWLLADYGRRLLLPEERFEGFTPPEPSITKSVGHHREWIEACKSGGPTTCGFDYSGPLSEGVLIGNLAFRLGRELHWDAEKLEAKGCPEAAPFIRREYRAGW